jgi:hypothetical protein
LGADRSSREAVPPEDTSIGALIGEITTDLSRLMRQEVELAKAEVKEEANKAGKGAAMYGAAGFAGYLTIVLLSFAAVFGVGRALGLDWAALIIAAVWALIGAVLFTRARNQLRQVDPKPRRTVETLKEDAQWAKHPTS